MSLLPVSRERSFQATGLLEAVRQRQAAPATAHLCHWVHRHGLIGLDALRREVLIPELGADADLWLQGLMTLDAPETAPAPVVSPAAAVELSSADAQPFAGIVQETPAPEAVAAAASPPTPVVLDLRARAEAAVDAAFAALEHSFPEAGLTLTSAPVSPSDAVAQAEVPFMAASPLPAAAPAEAPFLAEAPGAELMAVEAADPVAAPLLSVPEAVEADVAEDLDPSDPTDAISQPINTAAFVTLWRRLDQKRSRGMRQLRGVLRDCFEESVSAWRDPHSSEAQPSAEAASFMDGSAEASPSVIEPVGSPVSAVDPQPSGLDIREASPEILASPLVPLPVPQPAPQPESQQQQPRPESPSVLDRLSQVRQQRQERRGEGVRRRPAPSPAALSDLRAWLPDAQDLPRAS